MKTLKLWLPYRSLLISSTLVIMLLSLLVLILVPEAGDRQVSNFVFPEKVDLPNWQFAKSTSLPISETKDAKSWAAVLAAKKYIYTQSDQELDIEMRYEVGTLGNIFTYIEKRTSFKSTNLEQVEDLHQKTGIGFYGMYIQQGRSHLISCINPKGETTVTPDQFQRNRYAFDLKPQRLLPWLLGQVSLLDRRCLWADLSLPMDTAETASSISSSLESAWISWYEWWSQNFPPH